MLRLQERDEGKDGLAVGVIEEAANYSMPMTFHLSLSRALPRVRTATP